MPRLIHYTPSSVVYVAGDVAEEIYILKSGRINLVSDDIEIDGEIRKPIATGEFFGVKSVLGRYVREETAVAITDATVLALKIDEFERIISSNVRITMKMLKVFSTQLRYIHAKVHSLLEWEEEIEDPEGGLYRNGLYYKGRESHNRARYIFRRYLEIYPSGRYREQVSQLVQESVDTIAPNKRQETALNRRDSATAIHAPSGVAGFERFTVQFGQDEMIFSEYESGNSFYLIQKGRVQLTQIVGNREKNIDVLYPGELFGEMSILEEAPRSANAIAMEDVVMLEFNRNNLEVLLQGNIQITTKLLKLFAKRIYQQKRRFTILMLDDIKAKVADVFLMLDETSPQKASKQQQRVFQTNTEDIARWAAISTEESREVLDHFVAQQKIELKSLSIVVFNINDFRRLLKSYR